MNSNLPSNYPKKLIGFLIPSFLGIFMVFLIICAAFTLTPSIANKLVGHPSPTHQVRSWSLVELSKPTYTPSPVPTSTSAPTDQFSNMPAPTEIPLQTELFVSPASETAVPPLADEIVSPLAPTDIPPQAEMLVSPPSATDIPPQLEMNYVYDLPTPTDDIQTIPENKYILVSISQQHLYAYKNGRVVYSFIASTGMGNSTRIGTFSVLDKIPNAYGATWNIWMPNWLGIYWSGSLENGIHALPILPDGNRLWSGYLGTPISFGCVVLGVDNSIQLYNWADIGTQVEIQW